ncbi:MAG: sodium-dependent transporter [Halieaceae bacterium]|nr:sodium-dependent transporter [Halieaceae bacterium]
MARSPGILGNWHSRTTFVLALAAFAVGLGNVWRFPYLLSTYGGGLFMLAYVGALVLLAVPILVAEVAIGGQGRGSPPLAMMWAADRSMTSRSWAAVGLLICAVALMLLVIQVVVSAWVLGTVNDLRLGGFSGASVIDAATQFERLLADPTALLQWQSLFLFILATATCLGIRRGVGVLVWILVPAIVAVLMPLMDFALRHGDLVGTENTLFAIQPLDFGMEAVLFAVVQAAFTLGIGAGVGMTYGAYSSARLPVVRSILAVAIFDCAIGVGAAVAVVPLVLGANLELAQGPALAFIAMPYVFGNLPDGEMYGVLFYALLLLIALGSALALMEVLTAAVKQLLLVRRLTAAVIVGAGVWALCASVTLSLSGFGPLGIPLMQFLDSAVSRLWQPLAVLGVGLFVAWVMHPVLRRDQLARAPELLYATWLLLLRYVSLPVIMALFVVALFH